MFREFDPGLNPMNTIIHDALDKAKAAVRLLNDHGATVLSVEVRGGRPLVRIDGPSGAFLYGAMKTRRREGNEHKLVLAASVQGCQVEWTERHAITLQALPA